MGGTCSTHWREEKNNILVGRSEGKRLLGIPGCRREDNIRMDLRK